MEVEQIRERFEKVIYGGGVELILIVGNGSDLGRTMMDEIMFKQEKDEIEFDYVWMSGLSHVSDDFRIPMTACLTGLKLLSGSTKAEDHHDLLSKHVLSSSRKPIIIVLEQFEVFASYPKKQTFIYSLLDVLNQPGVSSIGLFALTECLDVEFLFEKRVKSRFADVVRIDLPPFGGVSEKDKLNFVLKNLCSSDSDLSDEICFANIHDNRIIQMIETDIVLGRDIEFFRKNYELADGRRALRKMLDFGVEDQDSDCSLPDFEDWKAAHESLSPEDPFSMLIRSFAISYIEVLAALIKKSSRVDLPCPEITCGEVIDELSDYYRSSGKPLSDISLGQCIYQLEHMEMSGLVLIKRKGHAISTGANEHSKVKCFVTHDTFSNALKQRDDIPSKLEKWVLHWIE